MLHYKNLYTCAVLSALLLLLTPIDWVNGEEEGAPVEACVSMKPGHGYDSQLLSSSPFKTEIPTGEKALMGETLKLELSSTNQLISFKGFLIMAFDVKNDTKPIGTFKLPSDGKVISCTEAVDNAATHKWNNDKKSVTVDWIPPTSDYVGTVIFRTTYVLNISTYWVKTESIPVSFEAPVTTPKPTDPPSSASQSSSTLAGLAIFSLLAFLMR